MPRVLTSLSIVAMGAGLLAAGAARAAPGGGFDVPPRRTSPPTTFTEIAFDDEEPGVLDLHKTEEMLATVTTQPYSASQLQTAMLFNPTCWEELYGPSAPAPTIGGDTGEAQCFMGPDGEEICWAAQEVEEYWREVDEAETQWNPTLTTSSAYPYTDGHIDTNFWKEAAREDFLGCMGAAPSDFLSLVAAPPPTAQSCLQAAQAAHGDVCLPVDTDVCSDLDYYRSWCGRLEMEAHSGDATWQCITVLEDRANATMNGPSPMGSILVPQTMHTPNGDETNLLQHTSGPHIELFRLSPMATAEVYDLSSTGVETAAAAQQQQVDGWDLEPRIESCEEYAYDVVYGLAEMDRLAAAEGHNPRWIFDYAHAGPNPRIDGPLLKSRDGSTTPTWRANGKGPWSVIDPFTGEDEVGDVWGDPRAYRSYHFETNGYSENYTFKNVYAYIHALRQGPPLGWSGLDGASSASGSSCKDWRAFQRNYYGAEFWDDATMDQRMAGRGYTDADYAHVQAKQDELWALFLRFVEETDLGVRRDLLQQIDERLLEGKLLGCIPDWNSPGHSALTVCDWSPEFFVDRMAAIRLHTYDSVHAECVEEVEKAGGMVDGTLDEITLLETVRDPETACAGGLPSHTCENLRSQFAALAGMSPLASHGDLTAFFDGRREYWSDFNSAVGELPPEALGGGMSTDLSKASSQKFFGAATTGTLTSGLRAAQDPSGTGSVPTCEAGPFVESDSRTGIRFLQYQRPILENYVDVGALRPAGFSELDDNGTTESLVVEGGAFNVGIRAGGHLGYEPGTGNTTVSYHVSAKMAASFSARYSLQYGVFTLSVRIGVSGGAGMDVDLSYQAGPTTSPPEGAPSECANSRESLTFAATPSTSIEAKLDAGVGIGIANVLELSVGVGGRLTIINLSFPSTVSASFDFPAGTSKPTPWRQAKSEVALRFLSGSLYLFARLTGPFNITLAEVTHEFARWGEDNIKRWELANEIYDGEDFCDMRLGTAGQGSSIKDSLLCACSDNTCDGFWWYCEDIDASQCGL